MAKKVDDTICLNNYAHLCQLFSATLPDAYRFEVVYGYVIDAHMMNYYIFQEGVYNYGHFAIGYDTKALEIVFVPVTRTLDGFGPPVYLNKNHIKKAKLHPITKSYTIWDKSLKRNYIQFYITPHINQDPDEITICIKQDKQAERFTQFFKNQFCKKR